MHLTSLRPRHFACPGWPITRVAGRVPLLARQEAGSRAACRFHSIQPRTNLTTDPKPARAELNSSDISQMKSTNIVEASASCGQYVDIAKESRLLLAKRRAIHA